MLRISNHYVSKVAFSLLFVEVLILIGSFYVGSAIRYFDGDDFICPSWNISCCRPAYSPARLSSA